MHIPEVFQVVVSLRPYFPIPKSPPFVNLYNALHHPRLSIRTSIRWEPCEWTSQNYRCKKGLPLLHLQHSVVLIALQSYIAKYSITGIDSQMRMSEMIEEGRSVVFSNEATQSVTAKSRYIKAVAVMAIPLI